MDAGFAAINVDGEPVANRGPGNLLGEASFITGELATASVEMAPDSVIGVWPYDKLDALTRAQPDVAASLLSTFAKELTRKLKTRIS